MDQINNMMPMMQPMNKKYKTQLCRHVASGRICQLGDRCQFAHSYEELRQSPDASQNFNPMPKQQQMKSNFKTIPCKYFQQGYCKNQDNCTYAHGEEELRYYTGLQQNQPQPNPYGQQINLYDQPHQQNQQQLLMQQQQQQQMPMPGMMAPPPPQLLSAYFNIYSQINQMFQNDENIVAQLSKIEICLKNNDVDSCNNILLEMINDPQRTQEERNQINFIVESSFQMPQQYMMDPQMSNPMQPYDPQQMQMQQMQQQQQQMEMQQMQQMNQQYPQMQQIGNPQMQQIGNNEMNTVNQQGEEQQQQLENSDKEQF